jgi:hypothetical protein
VSRGDNAGQPGGGWGGEEEFISSANWEVVVVEEEEFTSGNWSGKLLPEMGNGDQ